MFDCNAPLPSAELLSPVVLASKLFVPTAVLLVPVVFAVSAD